MGIIGLIKSFLLISGGLAGLLVLLVSYVLQLPTQEPLQFKDLDSEQQQWFSRGETREVLGHQMFSLKQGNSNETLILIHGFPTSSFDYIDVVDKLSEHFTVVVFDHLGFGFSDKPVNYTYSLMDQADQALALWKSLGIRRAHLVSHDMGDSVLTEILSRHQRGMLPDYFNGFFRSVTFTNGGMVYDLINMRLSQVASQQEQNLFEPRWLESLSKLKIPIQLLWGDSDSVSPMAIPLTVASYIDPQYLTFNRIEDTVSREQKQAQINFLIMVTTAITANQASVFADMCLQCLYRLMDFFLEVTPTS